MVKNPLPALLSIFCIPKWELRRETKVLSKVMQHYASGEESQGNTQLFFGSFTQFSGLILNTSYWALDANLDWFANKTSPERLIPRANITNCFC